MVKCRDLHAGDTSLNHVWDSFSLFFLSLFLFFGPDIIKVMYFFFWRSSKVLMSNKKIYISSCISIKTQAHRHVALLVSISYSRVDSQEPLILKKLLYIEN